MKDEIGRQKAQHQGQWVDLDEQDFDHTLAADLHLAIVEVGTPYEDLGHMAHSQNTIAFLPDDGSILGEDLFDNAGLFHDTPEAIVDIEDSKFNGHTLKSRSRQARNTTKTHKPHPPSEMWL